MTNNLVYLDISRIFMMENTTTTTEQMAATESVEGAETQNGATETQDEPSPAAASSDGNANGSENGTEEEEEKASKTKTVDGILAKVQCGPQILCFSLYTDHGV